MTVELFGKKYVVKFAHDPVDKWTTATLYELVEGKPTDLPVAVGVAFCNVKDTFSRTIGRKVAYADLLDKAMKRLFRQEMWAAYFTAHPNDKKG